MSSVIPPKYRGVGFDRPPISDLDRTVVGVVREYTEALEDNLAAGRGLWRMGDVGYKTKWGCVHLLDREVDMIEGFGSTLAAEDHLFGRLPELAEVIIIPGPAGGAVPVVCTRDDKPLDKTAWRDAVAGLPPMAEPVQWPLGRLPQTATTKIKRLELARLLTTGGQQEA